MALKSLSQPTTELDAAIFPIEQANVASPASASTHPDSEINGVPKDLAYSSVNDNSSERCIGFLDSLDFRATNVMQVLTACDITARGLPLRSILNGWTLVMINGDFL